MTSVRRVHIPVCPWRCQRFDLYMRAAVQYSAQRLSANNTYLTCTPKHRKKESPGFQLYVLHVYNIYIYCTEDNAYIGMYHLYHGQYCAREKKFLGTTCKRGDNEPGFFQPSNKSDISWTYRLSLSSPYIHRAFFFPRFFMLLRCNGLLILYTHLHHSMCV